MGRDTKITDETLMKYIRKGMKNAEIEKELGAGVNCLAARLRRLRADIPMEAIEEHKPELKGPHGIDYGAKQAAKLIEQAHVDVEGFMAELKAKTVKPPERLAVALEHCGIKDHGDVEQLFAKMPDELPIGNLADDPITDFFPKRCMGYDLESGQRVAVEVVIPNEAPEDSFEELARVQFESRIKRYREAKEAISKCIQSNKMLPAGFFASYNDLLVLMDLLKKYSPEVDDEYSESDS